MNRPLGGRRIARIGLRGFEGGLACGHGGFPARRRIATRGRIFRQAGFVAAERAEVAIDADSLDSLCAQPSGDFGRTTGQAKESVGRGIVTFHESLAEEITHREISAVRTVDRARAIFHITGLNGDDLVERELPRIDLRHDHRGEEDLEDALERKCSRDVDPLQGSLLKIVDRDA
jgi:hypothetical protein